MLKVFLEKTSDPPLTTHSQKKELRYKGRRNTSPPPNKKHQPLKEAL